MNVDLFRKIGLTEGEIKVYIALLKLGETTIGPIGKESKVSKSKLYDILDKLVDRGLAGHVVKNNVRHFAANDPRMILEYLDRKASDIKDTKKEVERLLPTLAWERETLGKQKYAEVYEGFHGFKAIREELLASLKKGDELLVLGAPSIANEKWEAWLLDFHRRRMARGIGLKILFTSEARKYGAKRKWFPPAKVRYLPKRITSTNWIDIFNDTLLFVIIQEPIAIVIRDPSLAHSMRSYFSEIWKISRD